MHPGDPCATGSACNNVCNEDAGNCFVAGGTPCADDGNPCTVGSCDGAGTCVHTFVDTNNDGVCDAIENAGPNGGDANGDGTADSQQSEVTSLPDAVTGAYLTLLTKPSCPQSNVAAIGPGGLATADNRLPFGALAFTLQCESTMVTVYYHGVSNLESPPFRYLKRGPNPPGSPTDVIYFLGNATFGSAYPYGVPVGAVEFALQNNAIGDDTGDDGLIVDQGGPALPAPAATPAATPAALGLSVLALLVVAWRALSRRSG
ncbi:MAG: hypothetical protein N3C12_07195 [Candidatus Binatia bacterium]|nr:hypothetical protein [Candidatus Binatia bacterium]